LNWLEVGLYLSLMLHIKSELKVQKSENSDADVIRRPCISTDAIPHTTVCKQGYKVL